MNAQKLYITEVTSHNGQKMRFEYSENDREIIDTFVWKNNRWNNGGQMTRQNYEGGLEKMKKAGYEIIETEGTTSA